MNIELQRAYEHINTPENKDFKEWVEQVFDHCSYEQDDAELTIRVVDENEIHALNLKYRHKDSSTNVLSFPSDLPKDVPIYILGDIIICPTVLEREAKEQKKSLKAHWCHMVIHGVLHLLGFDHEEEQEAEKMESSEIEILRELGFDNPY